MNDDWIDANSLQKDNILQKGVYHRWILHGATSDFDEKGAASEALHVWQSFK
jgi:hypothetical protein